MMLLCEEDGKAAVCLARKSIEKYIADREITCPKLPSVFAEERGVFVTLTKYGELRGCIGYPYPILPLFEAIRDAAVSAATKDPRFPPVQQDELESITLEVTILTKPEPLLCPAEERSQKIEIGRHGLIIQGRGHAGLLLPQVATDYKWTSEEFLSHTCLKAGLFKDCWKDNSYELLTFEGQIFSENKRIA
ncbi:MAG: TIGR00296 family protein [Methanomicrobium sp.]|nr:TIGR00296 family protein [Methanomicrobium sp.]